MLEQLKKVLPKPIYETWFVSSLIPTSYENDVLVLAAAQKFVCNFGEAYDGQVGRYERPRRGTGKASGNGRFI